MNSFTHTLQTNRPIKYSLIIIVIIGIILISLPFAIQLGAEYAIKEQGAKKVSIEDINLNLFTGKFELKNLNAQFNDRPALELKHLFAELKISALFQSKTILENIDIKGLNAIIKRDEKGAIDINGYQIPTSTDSTTEPEKTDSKPLAFAVNTFSLTNSHVIYQENGFEQNLLLNDINISNIRSWDKDSTAQLTLNIKEGETDINADIALTLFSDVRKVNGHLKIQGLNTQTYKKFHEQHIDKLHAKINANLSFNIDLSEKIKGNLEHDISLSQVNAHYNKLAYSLAKMTSQGKTSINGNDIIVNTELHMDNSQLTDLKSSTLLNSFKTLSLEDLHYDTENISFKQLSLKQIDLIENQAKKKLVSLASLVLNQFKMNTQSSTLNLALIDIQQPDINATLSKQKQLTHLELINPILERFKSKTEAKPNTTQNKKSKPLAINIEQVTLTKPGLLHFNDLSIQPNYSTKLHFNKIDINNISSIEPANFVLALKQGEYTTIDINGKGLLFNPSEDLAYTITIKQLDLPPVSSYTSQAMGYSVKSGVVDSVIKGTIKKQKIDTKVELKIDSVEVVETDKETAKEISGASGMSIGLALSTLKDKHNIIDLELPIGGNIKKPDFDLSLIINKAMGIAMKAASISYLKTALQPFSSLFTLYDLASAANTVANQISLAPISFSPNKTVLSEQQKELLGKVSGILIDRPGIKIKTCSIASLSDQNAIKQQFIDQKKQAYLKSIKGKKLTPKQKDDAISKIQADTTEVTQAMKTLANKRSGVIKAYLTQVKKNKSSKILNCLSSENLGVKSQPIVEIVI